MHLKCESFTSLRCVCQVFLKENVADKLRVLTQERAAITAQRVIRGHATRQRYRALKEEEEKKRREAMERERREAEEKKNRREAMERERQEAEQTKRQLEAEREMEKAKKHTEATKEPTAEKPTVSQSYCHGHFEKQLIFTSKSSGSQVKCSLRKLVPANRRRST